MTRSAYENEREAQLLAVTGAFVVTVLLLITLFFIRLSYSVPQPPPIEFVEVNFGTERVGSGRIQTYNRPSASKRAVDVRKAVDKPNAKVTTTNRVERTPVTPVPKVAEAKTAKVVREQPDIASKVESPVSMPERPEPKKTTAPAPTPAPPKAEPESRPSVKKVETVDPNALYKRSSGGGGSNGTVGRESGTGGNNNGDDRSGVGDKGNPGGKIDATGLYGKPGGMGSGVNFAVEGWSMSGRPNVNDDSDETGKIVFELTVNQSGDITNVRTKQTTVSPSVVDVYKKAVQRLRLVPKSSVTPPTSKGTITFIIKSK